MSNSGVYLWALVAGFLVGVFTRSLLLIGLAFAFLALLLAVLLFTLAFSHRRARRVLFAIALALAACAGGILRMNAATVSGDPHMTAYTEQQVSIEGVVSGAPDVREAGEMISIAADTLITKYEKEHVRTGVIVSAPPHLDISYGDRILAYGILRIPEAFDTGAGRQFNYPEYLAAHGIEYQLTGAQVERESGGYGEPVKAAALWVRAQFLEGLHRALPEPEAGLASGITVGDKRAIGQTLSNDFRIASLAHIVVFSGYHVGVIGNAARAVVSWLPKLARNSVVSLIIIFFVLMSGGSASAVRAGAMALIAIYARASGRTYLASRALGVVAAGMVLYDPFLIAFDPSFQLSVLAMLGIIVFTPLIAERSTWVTAHGGLREILASTIGAQLAVLPLLLYQSGTLSFVSLPANILALAPVPYAIFLSLIAGAGGALLGVYAAPLAAPAYFLLAYIIGVARFFASLPFSAASVPAFSAWWLAFAYALLFGPVTYYYTRSRKTNTAAKSGGVLRT